MSKAKKSTATFMINGVTHTFYDLSEQEKKELEAYFKIGSL